MEVVERNGFVPLLKENNGTISDLPVDTDDIELDKAITSLDAETATEQMIVEELNNDTTTRELIGEKLEVESLDAIRMDEDISKKEKMRQQGKTGWKKTCKKRMVQTLVSPRKKVKTTTHLGDNGFQAPDKVKNKSNEGEDATGDLLPPKPGTNT